MKNSKRKCSNLEKTGEGGQERTRKKIPKTNTHAETYTYNKQNKFLCNLKYVVFFQDFGGQEF